MIDVGASGPTAWVVAPVGPPISFHALVGSRSSSCVRSKVEKRESSLNARRSGRTRAVPMVGRSCARVDCLLRRRKKRGPSVGTQATRMPAVISAMTKMELSRAQYVISLVPQSLVWMMRPRLTPAVLVGETISCSSRRSKPQEDLHDAQRERSGDASLFAVGHVQPPDNGQRQQHD